MRSRDEGTIARAIALLFMLAGILFGLATPARAAVCAPATSQGTAPPSWQTYCWLDFSGYNDATAKSAAGQNFSYTLSDGATLTFNLRTTGTPGVVSRAAPSWTGAAVGNTAFLGIPNRPILYQQAGGTTVFTISGISITPPPGSPAVTAYSFVAADAESSNNGESLRFVTNGSNWTILDQVDPISGSTYPTIAGQGTATVDVTGVAGTVGGYIIGSNSPTSVTTQMVGGGLQGVMFAVRFASMRLTKVIGTTRIDPSDQFRFDIVATGNGTTLATGTTTGTGNGPFTAAALSLASGLPLTLRETMATGSASALAQYSSRLTCTNSTTGSTTSLPTNVATTSFNFGALQFGDAILCTFTNTPFPHLRVQKALGAGGRLFDTDQFTVAVTQGAATVAQTTTTGTGTTVSNGQTAMTQVTAGTSYGFSETAAGTTTLAQYIAAMSCTNRWGASPTALPTAVPGMVTPQLGDVIICTITNTRRPANATLTAAKSAVLVSDPFNGAANPKLIPGAIVTYAISVTNTGTLAVDAGGVFILDPLPATVTYNSGSAVAFTNGSVSSGLSWNGGSDVRFSNAAAPPASFAACSYTPSGGFDPNVRHVCIRPSGTMAGATAAGQPSFTVSFQTRIN